MTTERTIKYSKIVDTVPEAFAFVMSKLDQLGARPSIWIDPFDDITIDFTAINDDDAVIEETHQFTVVVEGSFEEDDPDDEEFKKVVGNLS